MDAADAKGGGGGGAADKVANIIKDVDPSVLHERGKSRGGTRGGKPTNQTTADVSLMGSGGMEGPNLDSEIEKCDGSVERTQEMVGALITKPKMTEKLLNKPPFRFLYDVIMEISKQTGFLQTLYTADEMNVANIAEKQQKLDFLDKTIKVVGLHLNTIVEVKSAKIIAGLDPTNTNNFLQLLALAAKNIPDSTHSVRRVLDDGSGAGAGAGAGSSSMPAAGAREAPPMVEKGAARNGRDRDTSSMDRDSQQHSFVAEPKSSSGDRERTLSPIGGGGGGGSSSSSSSNSNSSSNAEDDGSSKEQNEGGGETGGEVKRSSRPTTARRRPPKIKDGAQEVQSKDTFNQSNGKKPPSNIIRDGDNDDDDIPDDLDDDPKPSRLADDFKGSSDSKGGGSDAPLGDPQSKLVKDIMSRQAEQEAANANAAEEKGGSGVAITSDPSGNTAAGGIRLGRLRKTGTEKSGKPGSAGGAVGGAASDTDLDKVRAQIQTLVQHTGPLGTCMDYIQEDVAMMTSELRRWEEECRMYEGKYEESKKTTKEVIQPLQMALKEVEDDIKQVLAKIASTKASNARNDDLIYQQLKLIANA